MLNFFIHKLKDGEVSAYRFPDSDNCQTYNLSYPSRHYKFKQHNKSLIYYKQSLVVRVKLCKFKAVRITHSSSMFGPSIVEVPINEFAIDDNISKLWKFFKESFSQFTNGGLGISLRSFDHLPIEDEFGKRFVHYLTCGLVYHNNPEVFNMSQSIFGNEWVPSINLEDDLLKHSLSKDKLKEIYGRSY
jgi:hypothetical protein